MANATAITITDLTRDGSILPPTAQVLDTGTAAVALDTPDVGGDTGRIWLDVTNTAANNLTVTVAAGDNPPASRAPLGAYVSPTMAQNVRRLLGPFESARFGKASKLRVTFTPASGTIACNFVAYRLPKA